jgi:DNA-binding CsgD family transcriptional regulator
VPRSAAANDADSGASALISRPGFAGRERELAALRAALAGGPEVVLVEGEAGIGKSRLVQESLASPAGRECRALVAYCPPLRQPQTLGPVLEAVRQAGEQVDGLRLSRLGGALRPLLPEWAGVLPPPLEPLEDASAARYRVFRALADLLSCLGVAVLILEDAHWADEASLEFLLFLTSLRPWQVSLVVTYRAEDVPAGSLLRRLSSRTTAGTVPRRIVLGPLDVADTARMVSSMLVGARVSEEFAAFVHGRTDGVPLAVEESVRLMGDRGDVTRQGTAWVRRRLDEIDVPPTVRDSVLERAERLSADARAVLRAAAVLTAPAGEAVLRAVSGLPAGSARAGMAEGLCCGLLAEDGRGLLSFRHVLAARAVYDAIAAPDRRVLHLRAGRALENQDPSAVARLAGHFQEADEAAKWCQYAEQAADLALASGDEVTAAGMLHGLLAGACLPVQAVIRLAKKIPFGSFTGDDRFRDIENALRSALNAGAAGPAQEGELRYLLGVVLLQLDEWPAGRAELELAVPRLGHDPARAQDAMMTLSYPRGSTCPGSVHLEWLRRAAGLGLPSASAERLRYAVSRATTLLFLGAPEQWEEVAGIPGDAVTWPEWREIIRGHLNIGVAEKLWGRYRDARQRLARALVLASRYEDCRYHGMILGSQVHLDWVTGNWDGLAARAESLADDENLSRVARLEPLLVTGLLHAVAGTRAEAERRLWRVYDDGRRRADTECVFEPAAALAMMQVADGGAEEALRITDWPVSVVTGKGIWLWGTDIVPARVTALTAAGRIGQAAELVDAFASGLARCDAPAPGAGLLACRAVVARARGQLDRAAALFGRAAVAWQALPRPYDALLAREQQADCLLAAGRHDTALTLLAEVRQGLSALGARAAADRAARRLREHGAVRVRRGGRRGYGAKLSPRELEVVRLVMTGQSNREIARALGRSHNTVATQLKSAMRKLGVSSRTALAVSAVQARIGDQASGYAS